MVLFCEMLPNGEYLITSLFHKGNEHVNAVLIWAFLAVFIYKHIFNFISHFCTHIMTRLLQHTKKYKNIIL